ncbi:SDR family NAD(P)-dependent oxidoreductase [Gracilibacillus boraciitolerans]|nr:SDR family NAD(P)-dependent oxidoreductase [Gracilibacillus boraciitolerans]
MMTHRTLITGASGDIGKEIAMQFANQGHLLVLHYHHNRSAIDEIISKVPKEQILDIIQADLSVKEGLDQFLKLLPRQLDHFIFTSGFTYFGLFQDMTDQQMDNMLHLHLKAPPWKIVQHLIPDMLHQRIGKIVMITSIWG